MNIVLHCGGLPFNGKTINEKSLGGSESAAYYMARELVRIGHSVILFTNHQETGTWDGVKYEYAGELSEAAPLGDRFHFYAQNTPHDILIIQRNLNAFSGSYASKINILWLHDLALVRSKALAGNQMWNIDAILTVSEFHKKQICDVWGFNPKIIHPITNGIDLDMFLDDQSSKKDFPDLEVDSLIKSGKKLLTYSSRPERGLSNLVEPNGIMERLLETNPEAHLLVCGYDNVTPQMQQLYEYLWARCDALPNVTNLGALTKPQLANLMRKAWAHTYPTEFEEVSCITAMECAAAGLPFISSYYAALPETCKGSGSMLVKLGKDGKVNKDKFIKVIQSVLANNGSLVKKQYAKREDYSWGKAAEGLNNILNALTDPARFSDQSIQKDMIAHSDIVAYMNLPLSDEKSMIIDAVAKEVKDCYGFYLDNTFKDHYEDYYEYEKQRGVEYGPEDLNGDIRFESVATVVASLPAGSTVLDYGCAHGHYTVNLAKRFPELEFTGIDLAESNIKKAVRWAEAENLENVTFKTGSVETLEPLKIPVDCLLACEVLEHVADVTDYIEKLRKWIIPGGTFVATTPFGPWESLNYEEHWPWRAHLYHFDRNDLNHLVGHLTGYDIKVVPATKMPTGEPLGSYLWQFEHHPGERANKYQKKGLLVPRKQTVSLCMIVKDSEDTIERCLNSCKGIVDEIIIGLDKSTTDSTKQRIENLLWGWHNIPFKIFEIDSPLETGFAEARNKTITKASGDWILWLDADEELIGSENLKRFLRCNQFNAYVLAQHHFSTEPVGVIKVDQPCKLFRNHQGIQFYGYVHEHPEEGENKGIGYVSGISGSHIIHYGYDDEPTRRGRFQRNLNLLVKDREENPDRTLGKFLWLRDLSQMCQYEAEKTGAISDEMIHRAQEGVKIWRNLVKENLRMAIDALPFYSQCVNVLGKGFSTSFVIDTNIVNGKADAHEVKSTDALFANEEDAKHLINAILHERVKDYESKYF